MTGSGLTRQGAISLDNVSGSVCAPNLLPISLLSFEARLTPNEKAVQIQWQTMSESNGVYFLVERSTNAVDFEVIGEVEASNQGEQVHSYSLKDEYPAQGSNFYRLHQFDLNGSLDYSEIQEVRFSSRGAAMHIAPNPFDTYIDLVLEKEIPLSGYDLQICNTLGAVVMQASLHTQETRLETSHLPAGIYAYKVSHNGQVVHFGKLVSHQ